MNVKTASWFQLARRFKSTDAYWQRCSYRRFTPVQLRWRDNDLQGHVKDTVLYNCMTTFTQRILPKQLENDLIQPLLTASDLKQSRPLKYPQPLLAGFATSDVTSTTFKIHVAFFGANDHEWFENDDRSQLETDCYETEASVVGTQTINFRGNNGNNDVVLSDEAKQKLENYSLTSN